MKIVGVVIFDLINLLHNKAKKVYLSTEQTNVLIMVLEDMSDIKKGKK